MKFKYLVETGVIAGYNVYQDENGNYILNIHFLNGENVVIKAFPIGTGGSAGILVDEEDILPTMF